jgi:hypothetical protein
MYDYLFINTEMLMGLCKNIWVKLMWHICPEDLIIFSRSYLYSYIRLLSK